MADPVKGKTFEAYDHEVQKVWRKCNPGGKEKEKGTWSKPRVGWGKLNVDGAWMAEGRSGGTGMVLRNDVGGIIFTVSRFLQDCDSPLEAELQACNEGLALSLELSDRPIVLKSDCLEAVSMINDPSRNRSQVAALVNETKRLCTVGRECIVSHISRELNSVSHTLARFGHAYKHTRVWFQARPDTIREACNLDGTPLPL
jgi:ribonuclease HI